MKILKILGGGLIALVLAGCGFYVWAGSASSAVMAKHYTVHRVELPSPMPLTTAEVDALRAEKLAALVSAAPVDGAAPADGTASPTAAGSPGGAAYFGDAAPGDAAPGDPLAGVDLDAIAKERAIARGKHIVEARFVCVECHGKDFGGGVMVDDPMVGHLLGPNLTSGKGSVTANFTMADWDGVVRHGVKPDGMPVIMPSGDFVGMSDQELSDIVAYVRSVPPVDKAVDPPTLGPLLKVMVATGKVTIGADVILAHPVEHPAAPPVSEATVEFGKHLSQVCTGCHRVDLNGGPIAGAPPDWAPARNLTPGDDGLKGWTYDQFQTAVRTSTRPDGTKLKPPMDSMAPYAQKMSEVEMQALFMYLQSLPAKATGT